MYNDIIYKNVTLFCTESKDIPKVDIWEDYSYVQQQKSKFGLVPIHKLK